MYRKALKRTAQRPALSINNNARKGILNMRTLHLTHI